MRRAAATLILIVATTVTAPSALAQAPPPPPPPMPVPGHDSSSQPPKTGTARMSGRVTALETGRPVRRAVVRISGAEIRDVRTVSTDGDGRWELRELPAGRLSLNVAKGGFVTLSYGQRRPFEAGKTIDLAEGQNLQNVDVALPRGSAVSGRVVDEFGEPVVNARVGAARYRYMSGQRRMMVTGTTDTTDDRGEYRLHGLPPGDYYVTANASSFTFLGNSDDKTGYGQTYYPGTLNPDEAQRITLTLGQEAAGIVIALAPSRMATLRGTAMTSDGKPVPMGMITLGGAAAESSMSFTSGLVRDGTWTVSGVVPGVYQLVLRYMPNMEQIAMTGSTIGMTAEFAVMNITITGEDIHGINLVTSPGGTAKGTIRFDGDVPPKSPSQNARIAAIDPSNPAAPTGSGGVRRDWTFEIRNLVGNRLIRPTGLPAGWILKAVMLDGQDITDSGLTVAERQEIAGLDIVMTRNGAELAPEFLEKIRSLGTSVRLNERETKTITLKVAEQ